MRHQLRPNDSSSVALRAGGVASLAIAHPNLHPGERFVVRVHVSKLESKASARNECDGIRSTLEVFDTDTGKITVYRDLPDD